MIYVLLGKPRNYKKGKELIIDEFDDREAAAYEAYKMSGEMPSWLFWIDERREDEEIQPYICTKPEP